MLLAGAVVVLLLLVHLLAGRLHLHGTKRRRRWLSFAGGGAVALTFLHLLPSLQDAQHDLTGAQGRHVFLLALAGLALFYGLEVLARHRGRHEKRPRHLFWAHVAGFVLFNALVGHLIASGNVALLPFAVAMALHMFASDFALHEHHPRMYRRYGRWASSIALITGWGLATALGPLPDAVLAASLAFLTGAILLNVLKDELPAERDSSFPAFLAGVVVVGAFILVAV